MSFLLEEATTCIEIAVIFEFIFQILMLWIDSIESILINF